jgi:hypothetical protein
MSHATKTARRTATILLTLGLLAACGGSQPPAESQEAAPAAEPAPSEPAPAESSDAGPGEHTMPDGTTMPGSEHGEGTHEHEH